MPTDRFDAILRDSRTFVRTIPAKPSRFAEPSHSISPQVRSRLNELGLTKLYTHQAASFDLASQNKDFVVVTGTGTGKTLCYHLPTLDRAVSEPAARALYLFPTKALAQDQRGKLEHLAPQGLVRCANYDGDTPKAHRSAIRKEAHVVLTNPDMLHLGILPQHELWGKFLRSLRTIVVDEAHIYRGVFGGHVGWVLRRLLRLCDWYGSHPNVIACSATVDNPLDLLQNLTGRPGNVVDDDGGPQGEKIIALVPPAEPDTDKPVSRNVQSGRLLAEMAENHVRAMVFCRARVSTELVLRVAQSELESDGADPQWVASYRGGYTPDERRRIEERLFQGDLRGLATTNAMELGVDVGGLDVVVVNGYPGRVASFWQQVGRAGRAGKPGIGLMLASEDPLEQFLCLNPELLLDGFVEPTKPSVANRYVLESQLKCAAYERPLDEAEVENLGPAALAGVESLLTDGTLVAAAGRYFYPSHDAPAGKVNIRGSMGDSIRLMNGETHLGDMERWRAVQTAHPGAVYLHQGESYVVRDLDLVSHQAHLTQSQVDYFTAPVMQSVIEPLVEILRTVAGGFSSTVCGLRVTTAVTSFRRISIDGQESVAEEPLNLPPTEIDTVGVRLDFDAALVPPTETDSLMALHALEHVIGSLAPLIAGCDRSDLGTAWYAMAPDTLTPAMYLYDVAPGGLGLTEEVHRRLGDLLGMSETLLSKCPCENGCPLCVMSARCESGNELLSKAGALALVSRLKRSLG